MLTICDPGKLLTVIDGIVAGDGHISPITSKNGNTNLILGLGLKQLGFAEEFTLRMFNLGFKGKVHVYKNQCRVSWWSPIFGQQRKRWYPNGIKQLPPDLSNEPEMWRWLYAGDGTIQKCSTYGSVITIHVESFSLEEIERLALMLTVYGISAWPKKSIKSTITGRQLYCLYIKSKDTGRFLELIGPPVSSIEYKWLIDERDFSACPFCNNVFEIKRSDNIYCSKRCSVKANHPAYSKDAVILEQHRKKRREYERERRSLLPDYRPRLKSRLE